MNYLNYSVFWLVNGKKDDFTDVQSHVSKFNHGLITTWAMQVYALGSKTNGSPWPCGGEWVLEPIPARGVVI